MDGNTSSGKTLRLNTNYIILVLIVLSVIVFLVLGSMYFFRKNSSGTSLLKNITPSPSPKPGDPGTYALPLPFTHPNVVNGKFYYTVGGDVETISPTRITLISKDVKNQLPPFPLTADTKISFGDNTPATIDAVVVGKFVYVSAYYDLTTRSWTVTNITAYK